MSDKKVLLHFQLDVYRASDILAFYILSEEDATLIKTRLERDLGRVFNFGELSGKHSQVKFTGKDLLAGLVFIEDAAKISSFEETFSDSFRPTFIHPHVEAPAGKYFGSEDILALIQETWDQD